jgi:hypothetical protein
LEEYLVVRFPTPYRFIITQSITSSCLGNVDETRPAAETHRGQQDGTRQATRNEDLSGSTTGQWLPSPGGNDNSGETPNSHDPSPKRPQTA